MRLFTNPYGVRVERSSQVTPQPYKSRGFIFCTKKKTSKIKHRSGSQNANADYLSRALTQSKIDYSINAFRVATDNYSETSKESYDLHDEFDQFMFEQVCQLPVSHEDIAAETLKEAHLSPTHLHALREGKDLKALAYWGSEKDYSLSCGCLMYGLESSFLMSFVVSCSTNYTSPTLE
ncbi:Hypothetical protein NTJ_02597 [Nesidiocoris tenuis]|uniref:Uncharacterized protein n=1 Tax=Nesidiocoris tenuis TaxID=355587 RepID=A0ABN7AG25_9HEMI|nr:Hypothetical protein NTJ_02597 [Nesidiocoris tenuis]